MILVTCKDASALVRELFVSVEHHWMTPEGLLSNGKGTNNVEKWRLVVRGGVDAQFEFITDWTAEEAAIRRIHDEVVAVMRLGGVVDLTAIIDSEE